MARLEIEFCPLVRLLVRGEVTETTILTMGTAGTIGRQIWWGPIVTGRGLEEDAVVGEEGGIREDQKLRSFPTEPFSPFLQEQRWLFTFFTPRSPWPLPGGGGREGPMVVKLRKMRIHLFLILKRFYGRVG